MKAIRETDTFDTLNFCNFRYCNSDPINRFIKDIDYYSRPVHWGIEHAILHLLYSRFFTKA